jgi:hypothetical protein
MIEYGPVGVRPRGDEAEEARVLLGGEARAAASDGFLLTDDDAAAYRAALLGWLRMPAGVAVDGHALAQGRLQLRRRLQDEGRWPPAAAAPAALHDGATAAAVRSVLGERYEMTRAGQFVSARARENGDALLCGLVGGTRADAVDVLRLAETLAEATADTRRIAMLLDCESHSARAPDERVILSEYLAALAGAVSRVCISADARLRVLPRAAMAAINKVEGEAEGTVARALETGAVDAILDDCGQSDDVGR